MARSRALPWPRASRSPFAWWRDHWRDARESLSFITEHLSTSLLVWLLIGIALALPAGLYLLQRNLAVADDEWQGRVGLSVYFTLDATPEQIEAGVRLARESRLVADVNSIDPATALREFESFAGLANALELLDDNPLPHSLKLSLVGFADLLDLQELAERFEGAAGVDLVVVEKHWLERLAALTTLVKRLGLLIGVLFAVGAVLVTAASVRLAIEARLDELRVQKLVGASPAFLRRPFLYFGILYGLGGALLALMVLSLALVALEGPLVRLLESYGGDLKVAGFDPSFLAGVLLLGALLGLFGALLASRSRLDAIEIV
ncbi:MAG: permease-like cell division protein FtsX [Pseudomonadota bacterium]